MAVSSKRYIKNCTGENFRSDQDQIKEKIISRIVFLVLFVLFIGVSLYVLLFSPYLQVNNVTIVGTQELNQQDIQQAIEQSMEGKYLKIIPKNNFLFFSQGKVANLLTENFKKIRSVRIEKKFPDSVSVTIDERKALLTWCVNQDQCYLIDENGTAYSQADFNSPELTQNHLLKISDQSATPVAVGDKVIDSSFEQYLTSLKDSANGLGLNLGDEYETPSRISEEINVKTDKGMQLLFSTQFPIETAFHTLSVILKKEISPDQLANVAYIDLRIENEAFYKLNTDNNQPAAQDAQNTAGDANNQKNTDKKSSK